MKIGVAQVLLLNGMKDGDYIDLSMITYIPRCVLSEDHFQKSEGNLIGKHNALKELTNKHESLNSLECRFEKPNWSLT